MSADVAPVWLTATELASWPTVDVSCPAVRCALRVPAAWIGPVEAGHNGRAEARWSGPSLAESLRIDHITDAEAAVPMLEWSRSLLALTDAPFVADPRIEDVDVLEMIEVVEESGVAGVSGVAGSLAQIRSCFAFDSAAALHGMAVVSAGSDRRLAHFYVVSGRRQADAWNVTLTFESACLPGTTEEVVDRNDHVRAGATLASMRFG